MTSGIEAIKSRFRQGQHAEAIADCEAACERSPLDPALRRLCASMQALTGNYARALELLQALRNPSREDPDILFNIGQCERGRGNVEEAARYFGLYTQSFAGHVDGWLALAECQQAKRQWPEALASVKKAHSLQPSAQTWREIGLLHLEMDQPAEALAAFTRAIELAPAAAELRVARGDAYLGLGRMQEAVADFRAALALAPGDAATLKKATTCLLESGEGDQALELCRSILKGNPDNLTARLGAEWVLSQLVPLWHVPMMNEPERNQAFHDALAAMVTPEQVVFEIGTGSGLLAMMAARLGARKVFTCEAVGLIAQTARRIVRRNGLQDRITVLGKPSLDVQVPADLPQHADILVHEIFSSELLGEHVLPAIEDAKRRLLKPGGRVLPAAASIMIALVGGERLAAYLHVGDACGFDLRDFNAIQPGKRPLYREDLGPRLLSSATEAFRFDFAGHSAFPAEARQIVLTAKAEGLCYGIIQWIRLELCEGVSFENHPSHPRPVSNWQHTVYRFSDPVRLEVGQTLRIDATHDRARPWFERVVETKGRR